MTAWSPPLPQSETPITAKLTLPATDESFARLREFVLDQASGLSPELVFKIDLVVEELLLNIINYAYEPDQPGTVDVECEVEAGRGFVLRLRDHGKPFNPLARPDPDLDLGLEDRNVGGLGIFLVKEMSLSQEYRRYGDINILEIVFENR